VRVRALVGSVVLVLVGAGCSSSAKQATPVRANAAGIGVAGLDLTGPNGVTAIGSATQTVPADRAFVLVGRGDGGSTAIGGPNITIGPDGAPVSVSSTTVAPTKEHDAIRAALRPLGIANDAIEFSLPDSSGGGVPVPSGVVQVEVPVAKLPQIGTAVVSAIEKVVGTIGGQGLRFAVRDCTTALSTARDKAVADAHKRAQALATAAGVKLGDLASVSEQPAPAFPFSYLANGGQAVCGSSAASLVVTSSSTPVAELDAKPEVELHESVLATYALGASSVRTIAAAGVGEKSGPADAADIVIVPQFQSVSDPFASSQSNKIDSVFVLRALASLGIAKTDVEVENAISLSSFSSSPSSSYVRVHVTVARLKAIGAKIVDAVKAIVGTDSTSGVLFSGSNCDNLLARARTDAVADAGKRIDKLARAANVHPGAIVGVAEVRGIVSLPDIDPCHPDVSSLSSSGLLSGLSYVTGSGLPSLVGLDATPKVTEQVSLSVNRGMSS
jgi:uncharacterized protein YggE